jgi:type IV fimbrial biogenesis protein FimT
MKHRTQTGVTLLELMTAIAILGILFSIAVPGFREFTRNSRTTSAQNELVTAFTLARSESLRRGMPVSVCASNETQDACLPADPAGTDWADGWIVFADNTAPAGEIADAADILQTWSGVTGETTVAGTTSFVQFQPNGIVLPTAARTFDVKYTGCNGPKQRRITITAMGSLTSAKVAC